MKTNIYITRRRAELYYKGRKIILKDDDLLQKYPIECVNSIQVFCEIPIEVSVARACLKYDIPIYLISPRGRYLGTIQKLQHRNIEARLSQYRVYFDNQRRLKIAKQIVYGKIKNHLSMLYRLRRLHSYQLDLYIQQILAIKSMCLNVDSIQKLRGYEGMVAKYYFQGLGKCLPYGFAFQCRSSRPPKDPANSLLSFGYTLLASSVMTAIETNGLDPFIGLVHESIRNNPALVLDLMEEFRTIIVDNLVIYLIESEKISMEDFVESTSENRLVLMKPEVLRKFIYFYEKRIQTKIDYENRKTDFISVFYKQASRLKMALKQDLPYVPFGFR